MKNCFFLLQLFCIAFFVLPNNYIIAQDCLENITGNISSVDSSNPNSCIFDIDVCLTVPDAPRPKKITFAIDFDSDNDGSLDTHMEYVYDPPGNNPINAGDYCLSDFGEEFRVIIPCNNLINFEITGDLSNSPSGSGGSGSDCSTTVTSVPATDTTNLQLPAELDIFSGYIKEKMVVLEWVTLSEINVSHFEIERMTESDNTFISIGQIKANNTTEKSYYSYQDPRATSSNYYRLKIVDLDGSFEYSPIIQIKNKSFTEEKIDIFPNPLTDEGWISIKAEKEETLQMIIMSSLGKYFINKNIELHQGANMIALQANNLPPGNYYLILIQDKIISKKMFSVITNQ